MVFYETVWVLKVMLLVMKWSCHSIVSCNVSRLFDVYIYFLFNYSFVVQNMWSTNYSFVVQNMWSTNTNAHTGQDFVLLLFILSCMACRSFCVCSTTKYWRNLQDCAFAHLFSNKSWENACLVLKLLWNMKKVDLFWVCPIIKFRLLCK